VCANCERKKGWKEVQKSIKLLREELKSAKEAFDNRENEAAKQGFEKCVEICRDNNCGTKQEMLEVYTGLADSCLALKDYQRAEGKPVLLDRGGSERASSTSDLLNKRGPRTTSLLGTTPLIRAGSAGIIDSDLAVV